VRVNPKPDSRDAIARIPAAGGPQLRSTFWATRGQLLPLAKDIQCWVAPPPVIALLKIIAFMDNPFRRAKDLLHLKELFRCYAADTDRIFSDEVFAAELDDVEYANAFLLGMDVGAIAIDEEEEILIAFLQAQSAGDEELLTLDREDMYHKENLRFQQQLHAFRKGIEQTRHLNRH
jgi:predicted nucleotidyltransferase